MRAMQKESISLQYHFNTQACDKNGDGSKTPHCWIDCYILSCYFPGFSIEIVRWKSIKQDPVTSRSINSKSI
jgi:hypothetical protein